jgi:hypothetical protein
MVSGAAATAESTRFVEGATGAPLLLHAANPANAAIPAIAIRIKKTLMVMPIFSESTIEAGPL